MWSELFKTVYDWLSDNPNVLCLRTLLALRYIELDLGALRESFEPFHLDRTVVDEDIRTTLNSDKAKTLFTVKPLDRANCHCVALAFLSALKAAKVAGLECERKG